MSRAAIAGDIIGSRFERSIWTGASFAEARCAGFDDSVSPPQRARFRGERAVDFELFHVDCHLTDDSVLTLATMEWLLRGGQARTYLRAHFRRAPRPELFGRFFRAWATRDEGAPCGSIGNGAAMRIAPVAYAATSVADVTALARENARATHQTSAGIAGAQAVALGVFLARRGATNAEIEREIGVFCDYDLSKSLDEWRPGYAFTSDCGQTVPVALRAFFEASDFEGAVRAAISLGGDTDTLACMAGALAGARWVVGAPVAAQVWARLDERERAVVEEFEARFDGASKGAQ